MKTMRQMLGAGLALCVAGAAVAAPISVSFTGTVSQTPIFDPAYPFDGSIDTGTVFSGSYTFDPAATDAAGGLQTGSYDSAGAPFSFTVSFGSPAVFTVQHGEVNIGIGNDFGGADFYTIVAPLVASPDALTVSMTLIDDQGTVFADDSLPAGAPLLDAFEQRQFFLAGLFIDVNGGPTQIEILGGIDSLRCTAGCASVPEPSSLWLLGAGLFMWPRSRRSDETQR